MRRDIRILIEHDGSTDNENDYYYSIHAFPYAVNPLELTTEEYDKIIQILDKIQIHMRNKRKQLKIDDSLKTKELIKEITKNK